MDISHRRSGRGAPVVLLHGIPGCGAAWNGVVERLSADAGADVIVPDLIGFGQSPPAADLDLDDLHAPAQATAVAGLLDQLGVGAAVVVGHDFGGPVALMLASTRPDLVSAVGLFATNAFADTPIPFPLSTVTWPVVGGAASRLLFSAPSLRLMLRQGTGSGAVPPDPSVYLGSGEQQRAIATIFAGSLIHLRRLYEPVEAALHSLAVPAVVGWGDKDPFFTLEQGRRTAAAAKAQLRVYEGAGHFLPHERPEQVAADVGELVVAVAR